MDPITLAIAAALAGGSMYMGNQSRNAAVSQAVMNQRMAQRNADRQFQLASAGRTDVYGNKMTYDPASNSWKLALTPEQQDITSASQNEQLKQLTQDAARNRNILNSAAERGRGAGEDYNRAIAGYRYDQPPSEDAIRSQISSLLSQADEQRRMNSSSLVGREALRIGKGSSIPQIVKAANDQLGAEMPNRLLQARETALQESGTRQQQHNSKYLPALAQFSKTAMGGLGGNIDTTPPGADLAGQQGDIGKLIESALATGGKNTQQAGVDLTSSLATNPAQGVGSFASLYSALKPTKASQSSLTSQASKPVSLSSPDFEDTSVDSGWDY